MPSGESGEAGICGRHNKTPMKAAKGPSATGAELSVLRDSTFKSKALVTLMARDAMHLSRLGCFVHVQVAGCWGRSPYPDKVPPSATPKSCKQEE